MEAYLSERLLAGSWRREDGSGVEGFIGLLNLLDPAANFSVDVRAWGMFVSMLVKDELAGRRLDDQLDDADDIFWKSALRNRLKLKDQV